MLNERQKTEIQRKINHDFINIQKSDLAVELLQSVLNDGNNFNSRKYNADTVNPSRAFVAYENLFKTYNHPNPSDPSCLNIAEYNTSYSPATREDVGSFLRTEINKQIRECKKRESSYTPQSSYSEPSYRRSTSVESNNVLALFANQNNRSVANSIRIDDGMIGLPTSTGDRVYVKPEVLGDMVVAFPKLMKQLDYTTNVIIPQLQENLENARNDRKDDQRRYTEAAKQFSSALYQAERKAERAYTKAEEAERIAEEEREANERDRQWRKDAFGYAGAVAGGLGAACVTGGFSLIGQATATTACGAVGYFSGRIAHEKLVPSKSQLTPYKGNNR